MKDAVIFGDLSEALACYNDFKASSRVRFPFNGGRLDQPEWVLHNLATLAAVDECIELGRELDRIAPEMDAWDEYALNDMEGETDDTVR